MLLHLFFSFLVLLHLLSSFCTVFLNGFVLCVTPFLLRSRLFFHGLCIPTYTMVSAPFFAFPEEGSLCRSTRRDPLTQQAQALSICTD